MTFIIKNYYIGKRGVTFQCPLSPFLVVYKGTVLKNGITEYYIDTDYTPLYKVQFAQWPLGRYTFSKGNSLCTKNMSYEQK